MCILREVQKLFTQIITEYPFHVFQVRLFIFCLTGTKLGEHYQKNCYVLFL